MTKQRYIVRFLCGQAWALMTAAVWAQQPAALTSSGPEGAPRIAIKAGRLLDVRTGAITRNAFILVENGRIKSIGIATPEGVPLLDLSDETVLPGLIDCHEHILGNSMDQSPLAELRMSSPLKAIWGVHNLQIWLREGFTTLRDAGESDPSYGQLALRDGVKLGLIQGPRIVSAGGYISLTGGHGDVLAVAPEWILTRPPNVADTVEDVASATRRDIKYGADWIKLMASGGVSDPLSDVTAQELSDEQMAEAVAVAHRAHKKVMAHAHALAGIRAAVRAGVDSIEHGSVLDEETAALMAQRGTWLVPTFYILEHRLAEGAQRGLTAYSMEKGKALFAQKAATFHYALKHHVRIAFGVDDDPASGPKEFGAMVRAGMSPLETIQAATVNGAELLGLSALVGTLEPGKMADIVAVPGDPLRDIQELERVNFVMKEGVVVINATRASR